MTQALAAVGAERDAIATARLHAALRFATGVTLSFLVCEYMQWTPTYIAPLFFSVLITALPGPPPLKAGIVLILVMAAAALTAFLVTTLLHFSPAVMAGVIGVLLFVAFILLAHQKAKVPALLLLICLATVPVTGMLTPAYAGHLPRAFVYGMAIAVVTIWCVYMIWPKVLPKAPQPAPVAIDSPMKMALAGTLILLPLMILYMMFGWTDAMPVLTNTVILIANLDFKAGTREGLLRNVGVTVGGMIALAAFLLLSIMPSLTTLALITFLIGLQFAERMDEGGPQMAMFQQTFNTTLIVFGKAIASPNDSAGLWLSRLFQFTLAGLFAVAMMYLFFGKDQSAAGTQGNAR